MDGDGEFPGFTSSFNTTWLWRRNGEYEYAFVAGNPFTQHPTRQ